MSSTALPPLTLGRASGADLDAVMHIIDQAFDPRFGEAWTRAQCAGILPMYGVTLTLAQREGEPCGFSLARRVAEEAELLLLAVLPAFRGHGIGAALVDRFIEESRTAGARQLHLEVRDGNPAVSLYRHHLFTIAGRRRSYYRGPEGELFDALTMVRTI